MRTGKALIFNGTVKTKFELPENERFQTFLIDRLLIA